MANSVNTIQFLLKLRDEFSGPSKRALDTVLRLTQGAAQGAGRAAREFTALARASGSVRSERLASAAREARRLETTARAAKRELEQTAKSGERVAASLTRASSAGRAAMSAMRGMAAAGAGLVAGGMVAGRALAHPISYETRLTKMANIAFAEKDLQGKKEGMKNLHGTITAAVRQGGGSYDNAAEALNSMLAGNLEYGMAASSLPKILKASTGGDIAATDLSRTVLSGLKQQWFKEGEVDDALATMVKGGQEGSFEGRDMARWMPELMSKSKGMKGMAGFKRLVASLQGVAVVSGSNDRAANALVNLLGKLFAPDSQRDFEKIGIDLTGSLAAARKKGVDPLTAIVDIVEKKVLMKDKRYVALKKQAAQAGSNEEKAQLFEQMADIVAGSAVGKVFQDREAQLGLAGIASQKGYINKIYSSLQNTNGVVDSAFSLSASGTEFKLQQAKNEKDAAMYDVLQRISGPLKDVVDAATELAREFPGLTTAAVAATTAIGTMTAAAAVFAAGKWLGGSAGAGAAAAGAGAGAAVAAGGLWNRVTGWGSSALKAGRGLLGRVAGPAVAGVTLASDTVAVEASTLTRAQKNQEHSANVGATAGALAGAKLGAMGGTAVLPGWGTVIGGALGGVGGFFAGSDLGQRIGRTLWGPSPDTVSQAQKIVVKDASTLRVESVLRVDGREMARVVNSYNADEAKRD